ncbi:UNVERIFIED_CONTAM: hypothetical protein Cloal_0723 [Acetivibrio alkalicellulosi]
MPRQGRYKKEGWLTKAEAAKIIGCHPNTILHKCKNNKIPYSIIDGVYYISPQTAKLLKKEAAEFRTLEKSLKNEGKNSKGGTKANEYKTFEKRNC